jgi:outer membrane protein
MQPRLFLTLIFIVIINHSFAQKKWGLQECVSYALANNISIKQADLQTKISDVQYNQSKLSQYPSLNFNNSNSYNNGSNQDPATFGLVTQSFFASTLQLQASAQIFNWYSKQNTIAANHWQAEAAKASAENVKDNIILSVANAYLQILLARAQDSIAWGQLQQSQAQLSNTQKLVAAGSLPQLNASELESQVATDSANLIAANGNFQQSILSLKAYMNMDAGAPFDVAVPPVELIPIENIADLQPETVYASAIANLPQVRIDDYKLKAAKKNTDIAKAGLYPTFSAFGGLGSRYNNLGEDIAPGYSVGLIPFAQVGGSNTFVYPLEPNYYKTSFFRQMNENFYQSIGIGLSIPIFSGGTLRSNWQIAVLNEKNLSLQKDADNQTLKQNIYQAYNAAVVALDKFNAGKKTLETSQRSYDFAKKRYDVGILSTLELVTEQNNLFSAQLQYVQNQFDYVFKMKVLEFYKGQGLKL